MLVATADVSFMLEDYAISHRQNTAIGPPPMAVLARKFVKSATAVGANYRSACHSLFPFVTASV